MITLYQAVLDKWQSHISSSINPVPSTQYLVATAKDGSLLTINQADKEMAGGLVSPVIDYIIPVGSRYFGFDVKWDEDALDLAHKARNEMDLKITLISGVGHPIPNQANGSCQWNATAKNWQLDPTGSAWVDSGYTVYPTEYDNKFQLRIWSDGVKWSITGLRLNNLDPYTPPAQFTNLPLITTGWGTGLHAQLQTECIDTPFFLRCRYTSVKIMASDKVIPWNV